MCVCVCVLCNLYCSGLCLFQQGTSLEDARQHLLRAQSLLRPLPVSSDTASVPTEDATSPSSGHPLSGSSASSSNVHSWDRGWMHTVNNVLSKIEETQQQQQQLHQQEEEEEEEEEEQSRRVEEERSPPSVSPDDIHTAGDDKPRRKKKLFRRKIITSTKHTWTT